MFATIIRDIHNIEVLTDDPLKQKKIGLFNTYCINMIRKIYQNEKDWAIFNLLFMNETQYMETLQVPGLLVKSAYQKINFLISQQKHILWVLKRTVSMRRFFWAPKTYVQTDG